MLEEFQDLDNFKMLPHEMDYGQQLQQAEIDHEYGSQYDYQGQGDGQEDQWRDIYALQRPIAFRQDSQLYHRDNYDEHDAYDSNVFPPGKFD